MSYVIGSKSLLNLILLKGVAIVAITNVTRFS
ncbi:UNVERIFIED_CONTAM: hypothetical protein GTU68_023161 [Idotea baltica]|nr:hypothetical protein [Idotea baltica]